MRASAILLLPVMLGACASTPQSFYQNPSNEKTVNLCRAVASAGGPFKDDLIVELEERGETPDSCRSKVATQNAVITGVVVAGAAVAIGVAAHNGAFDGLAGGPVETYEWDGFMTAYGYRYQCRSTLTGQFAPEYRCAGKPRYDHFT